MTAGSEEARGAEETRALLAARVAGTPALLDLLLGQPPRFAGLEGAAGARVVTTGVGCSEGPARLLAGLLAGLGVRSRFVPLSCFVDGAPAGDRLVVFSQGLSPNATLALGAAGRYARALLLTSLPSTDRRLSAHAEAGLEVVTLPPPAEDGLLLRVQGPAVASLAAWLAAGQIADELGLPWLRPAGGLGAAIDAARGRVQAPDSWPEGPLALVTAGEHGALCRGLTSPLVEGLLVPEPPVWDLLSVAHGPFQQFYDGPMTLLALSGPETPPGLLDRLATMLVPGRHALLRLAATLPGPLGLLEHQAQLAALLIEGLRRRPRDLARWPGQGCDAPLYGISL